MMIKIDKRMVVFGLLLTAVIFVAHYFLPEKRLQLHPQPSSIPHIYGFIDDRTGISARWANQAANEWICDYHANHEFGCGWEVFWDPKFTAGIDFSAYESVEISLHYEGPATRVRLYMRNYNPAYASSNDSPSTKFLSMTIPVSETKAPVRVNLTEFSVAVWWLQEYNIRRRWALPEFDNITKIGIDFIEPGLHKTRVEQIVLIGKWVRTETLLLCILGFWMTAFLIDGLVRFYLLIKKSQQERQLIRELEEKQRSLEEDRKTLRELADTDPLTGVYNRTGVEAHLRTWFGTDGAIAPVGVMILDLDHFKRINDTYGHDMGDRALKAFATLMADNLRADDTFARWGGEEFVLICQNKTPAALLQLANKLRDVANEQTLGDDLEMTISVSIGITMALTGDHFDEALARADKALYRAKQGGRNRVEFEQ